MPGLHVEGMLTLVDCARGLTLSVRVGNAILKLHTETPSKVEFSSFVADVKDHVPCGPVKPERAVAITYKRSQDQAYLGEPLLVEFVRQ
jgi:hypothetical protein